MLVNHADPVLYGIIGLVILTSLPLIKILPSSGFSNPNNTFIKVVLFAVLAYKGMDFLCVLQK